MEVSRGLGHRGHTLPLHAGGDDVHEHGAQDGERRCVLGGVDGETVADAGAAVVADQDDRLRMGEVGDGGVEEAGERGEDGVADGALVVAGLAGGAIAVTGDVGDEESAVAGEELDYLSLSVRSGQRYLVCKKTYMAPPRVPNVARKRQFTI